MMLTWHVVVLTPARWARRDWKGKEGRRRSVGLAVGRGWWGREKWGVTIGRCLLRCVLAEGRRGGGHLATAVTWHA